MTQKELNDTGKEVAKNSLKVWAGRIAAGSQAHPGGIGEQCGPWRCG